MKHETYILNYWVRLAFFSSSHFFLLSRSSSDVRNGIWVLSGTKSWHIFSCTPNQSVLWCSTPLQINKLKVEWWALTKCKTKNFYTLHCHGFWNQYHYHPPVVSHSTLSALDISRFLAQLTQKLHSLRIRQWVDRHCESMINFPAGFILVLRYKAL